MRPAAATLSAVVCTVVLALTLGLTSARRGELLELTSLGLILSYALLLVVAGAYALGQWRGLRWVGLAPVAILLTGIPAVPRVRDADRALTDLRFSRNFTTLEAFAGGLAIPPGKVVRFLPSEMPPLAGCCYRAMVRRSGEDRLSAVFMLRRRLAYLYDPTGTAWREGVSARWRDRTALAPHWYRLAR
jgi:hypothetical protein